MESVCGKASPCITENCYSAFSSRRVSSEQISLGEVVLLGCARQLGTTCNPLGREESPYKALPR